MLSGFKHFAPDLKTMTLDNLFHVHASWSFPNATLEEWAANLKVMTSKFKMEEIKKMSMFKDIPVEVGVIYEGERIRRNDMQVELGGPTVKEKFELAKVKPMDEIEDGKITIIGPDLKDLKEGGAYPFGILVEAAGANTRPRS